jgi:hypothetical protein
LDDRDDGAELLEVCEAELRGPPDTEPFEQLTQMNASVIITMNVFSMILI